MKHFILFTGHMIDAKDRAVPRFPAFKEAAVREAIHQQLLKYKTAHNEMEGIASGACGSDILFHECCAELNIPTQIFLAMPAGEFKKNSVSFGGKNWDERFNDLIAKLPVHVLPAANENTTMNVYERTNEWMFKTALANGGKNMSLLAVWNGGGGDGKGGTGHMIKIAKEKNAQVTVIDVEKL